MKTAGWIALLAGLLAAVPPASAQPGGGRPGMERAERFRAERQALHEARGDLRRDMRAESVGDADAGRCEGPCRMTPEQRRQLRRDIHDAGADIYRRGPRRE